MTDNTTDAKRGHALEGFKAFASTRIIGVIIAALVLLWGIYLALGWLDDHTDAGHTTVISSDHTETTHTADSHETDAHATSADGHTETAHSANDAHHDSSSSGHGSAIVVSDIKGVTFVNALMAPMHYELNDRFLGWRPNDIIIGRITDNVRYMQRGTLEVTRRGAVALMERISRTGSTAAINEHVENAMNDFSISPEDFWLPSAESKYKDALRELEKYKGQLERKEVTVYTRPDNLIPLLSAFEDILGSCDDNLVKTTEDDGEEVSFFKSDDYFYYAKGSAHAMRIMLQAVLIDFNETLKTRRGDELLHHAIMSLEHSEHLDPWIILEGAPDGFLANHRANLAAHISHARFYLGQLIKALST